MFVFVVVFSVPQSRDTLIQEECWVRMKCSVHTLESCSFHAETTLALIYVLSLGEIAWWVTGGVLGVMQRPECGHVPYLSCVVAGKTPGSLV